MELAFKVFKLNETPATFEEKRYINIKNLCQRLSAGNRSVKMVKDLLRVIFNTQDALSEKDDSRRQLTCIQMKFHICCDLALACKISVQDLLRHASHKVYGCIT